MKDLKFTPMKERKNYAGPIGAIVAVIVAAILVYAYFDSNAIKYDKNAAIKSAQEIISIVSNRDFQTLYDSLPMSKKGQLTEDAYKSTYDPIIASAGSFVEYTKTSTNANTADSATYIYVIVTAKYENKTLTYTITLTPDMKIWDMFVK